MFLIFISSIFLSAVISYLSTIFVHRFFVHRSWVEDPLQKQKKTNNATASSAVPRGGGIPIFFSVLISTLIFLPPDRHLLAILVGGFFTLVVGIWDDLRDINPIIRLLSNFFAAAIVVFSGIGISYISNPLQGGVIDLSRLGIISLLLALFWIASCMNFVGWSGGVEGQLPGFVFISAVFIGILGLKHSSDISQWPVIILAATVAGSYLGFLPHNFPPQKIMPGYSGKSLAGYFLAVLAILAGAKLATVILLLGVPLIDASFVIIKRLFSRRSPFYGGPDHLHHHLLRLGWSHRQISLFYFFISFTLGFLSLFLNSQQKFYTFIGLILIFIAFILRVSRRI